MIARVKIPQFQRPVWKVTGVEMGNSSNLTIFYMPINIQEFLVRGKDGTFKIPTAYFLDIPKVNRLGSKLRQSMVIIKNSKPVIFKVYVISRDNEKGKIIISQDIVSAFKN